MVEGQFSSAVELLRISFKSALDAVLINFEKKHFTSQNLCLKLLYFVPITLIGYELKEKFLWLLKQSQRGPTRGFVKSITI